ncbi:uncharacterized protein LOC143732861 isoform X2 [Siphateles boraxobius]|uniref:uncharacterized protein LOC143732861 isoform X2 n=1 Tax=Siphateles boraxobius TaxID=180520 RepID=UPI0040649BAF
MKTHLKILSLFIVLTSVLVKSGDVFEGTVGEKVEIRCPYLDGYIYSPKYLCRDPCESKHVLIKSAKTDQVVSDGRYSLIDTASGRSFTVTISDLRLKDSGVYYCGIDKWFRDTLKKLHLSVRQVPVNRPSHTSEKTTTATSTWTTTSTLTSTVVTSSPETNDTFYNISVAVVCAGILVLLVFGVLVALVFLCRKRSHSTTRCLNEAVPENSVQDSPNLNQTVDYIHHIYDEMVTENSLAGPARDANFSVIYSTVHHCSPAPQEDVNDLYSLITHH